jgi:hypothetical protein
MSDAWEEIRAIKSSLRDKLQKREKECQDIINHSGGALASSL